MTALGLADFFEVDANDASRLYSQSLGEKRERDLSKNIAVMVTGNRETRKYSSFPWFLIRVP